MLVHFGASHTGEDYMTEHPSVHKSLKTCYVWKLLSEQPFCFSFNFEPCCICKGLVFWGSTEVAFQVWVCDLPVTWLASTPMSTTATHFDSWIKWNPCCLQQRIVMRRKIHVGTFFSFFFIRFFHEQWRYG
jgi:hypothetical protein